MIDMTPPDHMPRPIMRTIADYIMASVLAFAAFLALYNGMGAISKMIFGAPTTHHATTLYLAIAGVSVAFADPLGLFQRREGWQAHLRGAVVTWGLGFALLLGYFAVWGI